MIYIDMIDDEDYDNYETNFYKIVQKTLKSKYALSSNNILALYMSPDKIFTNEECDKIIKMCYLNDFYFQNKTDDENNISSRRITTLLPNDNTLYIYDRLRKLVIEANKEIWNFNLYDFGEPCKFIEYSDTNNSYVHTHIDLGNDLRTKFRKLIIVVQLTDENDYEGGDLLIQNNNELIPINRKRGTVVIFPSFLLHCVKPITKGIRNSLVTFVFGPPFC